MTRFRRHQPFGAIFNAVYTVDIIDDAGDLVHRSHSRTSYDDAERTGLNHITQIDQADAGLHVVEGGLRDAG